MERKTFTVSIDKSLQDSFREKCKNDGIKYNEVIEANYYKPTSTAL